MGLIKAATVSVSEVVGDQFKEVVTCPSTEKNALIIRGVVEHGKGNSNPTEGVITNGSKIIVPNGYAMMAAKTAMAICDTKQTLNCLFASTISPFPIDTAMYLWEVDTMIVLIMAINEMILPTTEKRP